MLQGFGATCVALNALSWPYINLAVFTRSLHKCGWVNCLHSMHTGLPRAPFAAGVWCYIVALNVLSISVYTFYQYAYVCVFVCVCVCLCCVLYSLYFFFLPTVLSRCAVFRQLQYNCRDVSSFGRGSACCASVCRCVLCAVNCIVALFTVLSRCAIFQQCYCPDVSELTEAVWTVGRTQSLVTLS